MGSFCKANQIEASNRLPKPYAKVRQPFSSMNAKARSDFWQRPERDPYAAWGLLDRYLHS